MKHSRAISRFNRQLRRIIERDHRKCWLCGEKVRLDVARTHPLAPTRDHVVEKRNHGWDSSDNLLLAHRFCNSVRAIVPNPREHPKWIRIVSNGTVGGK